MLSIYEYLQLLSIGLICSTFIVLLIGGILGRGLIAVHEKHLKDIYNLLRAKNAGEHKGKAKKEESTNSNNPLNDLGGMLNTGMELYSMYKQFKAMQPEVPPKAK